MEERGTMLGEGGGRGGGRGGRGGGGGRGRGRGGGRGGGGGGGILSTHPRHAHGLDLIFLLRKKKAP
eukprot:227054-Hanusia_phi.AAC.1